MNTLQNKYDSIEKIIFEEHLRITDLEIHVKIGKMMIFLNNNYIIVIPLSKYRSLKNAPEAKLKKFKLIADGTGIHWPQLDEDLSLKGFLKDLLLTMIKKDEQFEIA